MRGKQAFQDIDSSQSIDSMFYILVEKLSSLTLMPSQHTTCVSVIWSRT